MRSQTQSGPAGGTLSLADSGDPQQARQFEENKAGVPPLTIKTATTMQSLDADAIDSAQNNY